MDSRSQEHFSKLKVVCVPLLGASRLTPSSAPATSTLLSNLVNVLKGIPSEELTANLISYVFLPLSTILQRNASAEIPDQVLEKVFNALGLLVNSWWWSCDIKVWEQIFMLSGAVIGGIESKTAGKAKSRDDETKTAATSCLIALLRPRSAEEAVQRCLPSTDAENRLFELQQHTQSPRFVPIIGQTLDAVLGSVLSHHLPLQLASLEAIYLLVEFYLPDGLIPSVLPGVVSTTTKLCLGVPQGKGWAKGDIVSQSLRAMQSAIVKAIGDEACVESGAIRPVNNLGDIFTAANGSSKPTILDEDLPYGTRRTESWLRGTSSQVHIALNSLTPLLSHPTTSALQALVGFSTVLTKSTSLTLPQTQPLFLSFLLSLSLSDYMSVSLSARKSLAGLLTTPSTVQVSLQRTLMATLSNHLTALPRLLSLQSDARIRHSAGIIDAVCQLASPSNANSKGNIIAKEIGKLLGPVGAIEKWGWSLLSVLEFVEQPIIVTHTSSALLALENDPNMPQSINFPELVFKNVTSHETRQSLESMFRSLGKAGGDACLYSVEWFIGLGRSGMTSTAVAALWCASRLLEGISDISLYDTQTTSSPLRPQNKRLEKQSRAIARNIAEIWDQIEAPTSKADEHVSPDEDTSTLVHLTSGIVPLHDTLKITKSRPSTVPKPRSEQPMLHRALCLQLIAITAGITQGRFQPLFIHTLYPVLHSLVSPNSFVSSTALATLQFITDATSYASPANLLLSNFDYVLDSISRRLTQRWLDIDATKVLGVMVRLVGANIVERAGDVVEECFDRLDEFHGYGIIVDGLIEVLTEVIKVIEAETILTQPDKQEETKSPATGPHKTLLRDFFEHLPRRFDHPDEDKTNYGPAPREAWGEPRVSDDMKGPEDEADDDIDLANQESSDEPPPTPIQNLTKQIMSRSLYFLTHDSPMIRARILNLLASAVPVLPESSLLPTVHIAWPFVLNRLNDSETFVITAAAGLVEALVIHVGEFMFRRVWDDVWPKFRTMLRSLEEGEKANALTRRTATGLGSESAYTHSHRLYRSLLRTMTFGLKGVHEHEPSFWDVVAAFRRFLDSRAHIELQQAAVDLYVQASKSNPDAVWLVLTSTEESPSPVMEFMRKQSWDIGGNTTKILSGIS
ncbi:hypothetical protein D9619_002848 [Psilocybe cf. subviscida]|uniref:TEL2-interacting protein 1 n=1 Tax=Psilocybe cf. subviscida TaxID=2480587 RepID=A0A8H5AVZ7_9AGAR|nr:hypothetical protein D9619_002848 [Psilocybe cf. subviscida]